MQTFYIKTLGCKLNQYDSQVIEELLCSQDFAISESYLSAHVVIINTCTVTSRSDYEARRLIRKIHRENPNCLLVVVGCYAQRNPQDIAQIAGVDVIVGNEDKNRIHNIIKEFSAEERPVIVSKEIAQEKKTNFFPISGFSGHTRAFLKIQEGCNYKCSYCIVPHVRGRSRSVPTEQILSAILGLLDNGFKEIVLTGIDIGSWAEPGSKRKTLLNLLEEIEKIDSVFRIRLSSIEPKELSEKLINFVAASKKIVPHFHIPLQSGSDQILHSMIRPYTIKYYTELIQAIKAKMPTVCLGCDVIVGFPGEGEEEFRQTYELIETIPFSYLHVFPYSPREGTKAALRKQKTPNKIITARAKTLRELAAEKNYHFRSSFENKEVSCLVLTKSKYEGKLLALSDNYIKIFFEDDEKLKNQLLPIKITEVTRRDTFGELVSKNIKPDLKTSIKE